MIQIIELQLFGPVIAFAGLHRYSAICLERHEHYQKQGYRNRFQVLGAGGVLTLSVPLQGGRNQKINTADTIVCHHGKWQTEHWRTLESAYNHAPFFAYYAPSLKELWFQSTHSLWQFNTSAITWLLKQLKWKGQLLETENYVRKKAEAGISDLRNRYFPGNRTLYQLPAYRQNFGTVFETNLSVLDLLFCMGPQASAYLNELHVH